MPDIEKGPTAGSTYEERELDQGIDVDGMEETLEEEFEESQQQTGRQRHSSALASVKDTEREDEKRHHPDEKSPRIAQTAQDGGSEKDPNVVGWDGPDDPKNPKNWSTHKKWIGELPLCSWRKPFPQADAGMNSHDHR